MTTANDVIAQAERWLGTAERPPGSNKVPGITDWYGLVGAWCAMFVSRVFFDAGLPITASTSKGFAFTPAGAAEFKKQGRWRTTDPQRGYVVFFRMPGGPPRINHVGIVTGVNADGSVNTIEGNTDERGGRTGGKVMRKVRKVGIVGYGVPAYSTAPQPAPKPAFTGWDYQEEDVKTTFVTINTDGNGHGGTIWDPGFAPVPVGCVVQGADYRPTEQGGEGKYADETDRVVVKASPRAGGLAVTVSNAPANSAVGVFVSAAPQ